jgi:hypothetical protein
MTAATASDTAANRQPAVAPRLARARTLAGRVPRVVWAITGLWLTMLVCASLMWPMMFGPSEPQHVDMAYAYSAHPFSFHGPGELPVSQAIRPIEGGAHIGGSRRAETFIPLRGNRPSLVSLGGNARPADGPANRMVAHPPLYYWTEAVLLKLPGVSGLSWDKTVWLMRLLSVLYVLPVPVLAWAAARTLLTGVHRVGNAEPLAVLAAIVPLTFANLARIGSSVGNDSLLILAGSLCVYLSCRVLAGDLGSRTGILAGLSLAVAMLTKSAGVLLVIPVLGSYAFALRRGGSREGRRWLPIAAPLVGAAIGSVWWIHSVVLYHRPSVNGWTSATERLTYGAPTGHGRLSVFVPQFLDDYARRLFGGIGTPDQPSLGPFIVYGWFAFAALGLAAGMLARSTRGARAATVMIAAPILIAPIVALAETWPAFHMWPAPGIVRSAPGQYGYFLVVALAAVIAFGWSRILQPHTWRWLAPLTLTAAVLTFMVACFYVLTSWYAPTERPGKLIGSVKDGIDSLLRWSPLPRPLTGFATVLLPVLGAITALVVCWRWARSLAPSPPADVPAGAPS